ncbi:MAG TPA: GIY-YIG nuclease family protein [Methanocellales archaeon]|nr:GIY-YIG nuclease family protein [Methanocellales archaeon]
MKGAYVLLIELPKSAEIQVGHLGKIRFQTGFYAYVGSALGRLEARISRHLRKEKKLHWHIDHFLTLARIKDVYVSGEKECDIAKRLADYFDCVRGFGSSDCACESHLFYDEDYGLLSEIINELCDRFEKP